GRLVITTSNTSQDGTSHASRSRVPGSYRAFQIAGAARPARTEPGQKVTQNRRKYRPGGAPCASWPLVTLPSMSWPSAWTKKLSPDFATIATNHGSTRIVIQINPATGRKDQIHFADRSANDSATAVRTTNIRINGPFSKIPPAHAVHKMPASTHPPVNSGTRALAR